MAIKTYTRVVDVESDCLMATNKAFLFLAEGAAEMEMAGEVLESLYGCPRASTTYVLPNSGYVESVHRWMPGEERNINTGEAWSTINNDKR